MTTTTNYGLQKPATSDLIGNIINTYIPGALDKIDTELKDRAKFKAGSGTFTDNDTSQTFTDSFCTALSLVTVCITSATDPQGVWTVTSAAGSFTITSDQVEAADITFDYFIQKGA